MLPSGLLVHCGKALSISSLNTAITLCFLTSAGNVWVKMQVGVDLSCSSLISEYISLAFSLYLCSPENVFHFCFEQLNAGHSEETSSGLQIQKHNETVRFRSDRIWMTSLGFELAVAVSLWGNRVRTESPSVKYCICITGRLKLTLVCLHLRTKIE